MWKKAIVGAAALLIAGTVATLAQQPANPHMPFGPRDGHAMRDRHFSAEDLNAFADARIAALHAGLALKADQEKNWAPFEQALRDLAKMRIARIMAGEQQAAGAQTSPAPANPIERLQQRADAMTTRGTALKKLADAAAPLYQSLDDAQKQRFMLLASFLREHRPHGMMMRERDGMHGMRGEFRDPHHFGDRDMRGMDRNDEDGDYRGPL
jgi:hypothetical protein